MAAEERVVLAKEDFQDFKIGAFPYDPEHSAMGEYHYYPPSGYTGNWYCPITDHGWRGPMWLITNAGERRVMEATKLRRNDLFDRNVLVTGEDDWSDYTVEVEMRVLDTSLSGELGFRYQNSRCYYALCLEAGQVKFLRRNHAETVELFAQPYDYNCDRFEELKVECRGEEFHCYLNERLVCTVRDATFRRGKVALAAETAVQFANLLVYTDAATVRQTQAERQRQKEQLTLLRQEYPQPQLWKRIDLRDFGAGRSVRFGDLTGNGQCDLVIAQCQKRIYKDAYANISCLTALDLDGNILWQLGEPNPEHAYITADLPFQIADVDLDGANEVIVAKDFQLMILDGRTGRVKKSIPTPLANDPDESLHTVPYGRYAFDRVNVDCIRICNFSGRSQPTDILIKDRYSRLWAYDHELNLLWKYQGGITGHFPFTKDLNGDGREEMFVGYNLVDADGRTIWKLPVKTDHTDEIIIGRFDPERDEELIAIVAGHEGFIMADLSGQILVKQEIGHAQRISAANYRPDLPGLELAVTTFWGNQGIILLFDCHGRLLHSWEPGTNGNMITPVNWSGDGRELMLLNGHPEYGGLVDGWGRPVVLFPDDGHPVRCAEAIDLTGDCREEIVLWDEHEMWIYTQDRKFTGERIYSPEKYPAYNGSNYRGEYSWPGWKSKR
ncbi:MAG: hypothetical protein GX050_04170 [Firmicutes bacterium]|nr:hypothetical protein [Bacillota bacterium]